jgi:hypothetical protein
MQKWTCYIISMPSGELLSNQSWNQSVKNALGCHIWALIEGHGDDTICPLFS